MSETVSIMFKVKIQTDEPAELIRLLQSLEATLLSDMADAVRSNLAAEGRLMKVEIKVPQANGALNP